MRFLTSTREFSDVYRENIRISGEFFIALVHKKIDQDLFAAGIIWACAPSTETEIFIPVEPVSVPSGLCISHFPVNGLKVRVSGSKRDLEALVEIKPKYKLDLSGIKRGVQTIPVDPKRIPLPKNITFIEVTPSLLTVCTILKIS